MGEVDTLKGLSREQSRSLRFIAADGGTTHIWALKACRTTREALSRLGLVETRFPGTISLTHAGRALIAQAEQGASHGVR